MEFENLLALIDKVASTDLTEFQMEDKDIKLSLKRQKKNIMVTAVPAVEGFPVQSSISESQTVEAEVPVAVLPSGNTVKAPLVGTFYNASSPDLEAFVKVGDTVKKGQTLGIIEAMKLMNEIESEYDGIVDAILVENEQMVEYGQPIFVIR